MEGIVGLLLTAGAYQCTDRALTRPPGGFPPARILSARRRSSPRQRTVRGGTRTPSAWPTPENASTAACVHWHATWQGPSTIPHGLGGCLPPEPRPDFDAGYLTIRALFSRLIHVATAMPSRWRTMVPRRRKRISTFSPVFAEAEK